MLDWVFNISETMASFFEYMLKIIVTDLSELFTMLDNNSYELFEIKIVKAIVLFFEYFGWSMFVIGVFIGIFEFVMEKQVGKGTYKDIGLNIMKGYMAVMLFAKLPIELYKFAITLQSTLTTSIIQGYEIESQYTGIGQLAIHNLDFLSASLGIGVLALLFFILVIAYCVIKVFFFNFKRGAILLILIGVGSLYMFSVPRGYIDGYIGWCKQIIGLCLTTFLQTLMLTVGLLLFNEHFFIGLGLMLGATEVPRIAGHYGMDTSTRSNLGSSMYAINSSIGLGRNLGMLFKR